MKDRTTILLAIGRELHAWRKPFLISSAIVLTVVAIGMTILVATSGRDQTVTFQIGMVDNPPAAIHSDLLELLSPDTTVSTVRFSSLSEAEAALADRSIDALIVGEDEVVQGPSTPRGLANAVWQALSNQQVRRNAESFGLSPAETNRLIYPEFESRAVESPEEGSVADEVLSAISVILMFMAILAYGQWIGYAVVEEKANRVVEVLLGAIRPHDLMTAKVVAVGLLGLTQMAAVGTLALTIGLLGDQLELPAASATTVLWVIVWFLLGYAFYGSLYAAGGSLASNSQEAGSVMGPMSILVGIGYVLGLISMQGGIDTMLIRITSFIPFWAPLLMPGRIARGWAEGWEVALSLAIMVMAGIVMIRIAGRVYVGGVARATARVGWREAFRTGSDLSR
jgi:ABC-2 type transport system permease protein